MPDQLVQFDRPIHWSQVDLEAGTVEITSTIVRVTGQGLLRKRTKSRAGQRLLHLPDWAIAVLRTRHAAGIRLDDPIFTDIIGGFRDPSNVRRSLRTTLSPVGSTARSDLGLTLRALRRETKMTRSQVAETLTWPQTRTGSAGVRVHGAADAFLQQMRFGRGCAESTTKAYARSTAAYLLWCCQVHRDWRVGSTGWGAFMLSLRHAPGPGATT